MEKFLLFVKLICVKMSAESLMMRVLYLHSASFLISHSKALLLEIQWKLAQVHRQLIGIVCQVHPAASPKPEGRGFTLGHTEKL